MKALRALASIRLAAALIAVLLVMSVLSVVVPQSATLGTNVVDRWRESEPWLAEPALALGLDRVFHSWPFYVVTVLLSVNLAACTALRSKRRDRRFGSVGEPPESAHEIAWRLGPAEAALALGGGWNARACAEAPGGVVCVSGRRGHTGSLVMHWGMVAVILAGVVTAMTRFEGEMLLVEGVETPDVRESHQRITQLPDRGVPFTGAFITLEDMEFDYQGPVVTEARAYLAVREGDRVWRRVVRVNEPLRIGAKSFLLKDTGYTVGLRVTGPDGSERTDALVTLGEARPDGWADNVSIGPLSLEVLAIPDAEAPRGMPVAELLEPVDPAAVVTVTVAGQVEAAGELVRPGGSVSAGVWTVELLEVRQWTQVNSRLDHGMYLAYAGFAAMTLGFGLRMLDPAAVVRVALDGQVARVWGSARWGEEFAGSAIKAAVGRLARFDTERSGVA